MIHNFCDHAGIKTVLWWVKSYGWLSFDGEQIQFVLAMVAYRVTHVMVWKANTKCIEAKWHHTYGGYVNTHVMENNTLPQVQQL